MVRDIRIKEYRFSETIDSATTNSIYSDEVINGKIMEVDYNFNRAGSIFLNVSGTAETIYGTAAVSGTNTLIARPTAYNVDNTGTVTAGSQVQNYVMNDVLVLAISGAASGTQTLDVNVRYI